MNLIALSNNNSCDNAIKKAANVLKTGGVIAYPTDTIYGLGANAFDENAILRIYKIKKRDRNKPISVIVGSMKMARKIACIDSKVENILNRIWPGPVTAVLRKKDNVSYILAGNTQNIALRISENEFVSRLIREIDFPITATSINISGEKDLLTAEEIIQRFEKEIEKPDLVIDAGSVKNPSPSTIIDLTTTTPKILRMGIMQKDAVKNLFDKLRG